MVYAGDYNTATLSKTLTAYRQALRCIVNTLNIRKKMPRHELYAAGLEHIEV